MAKRNNIHYKREKGKVEVWGEAKFVLWVIIADQIMQATRLVFLLIALPKHAMFIVAVVYERVKRMF
jgi:hypothetical protein